MPMLKTLHDLFIHELKDVASAEEQLTKALPKMAKTAKSPELRQAFLDHLSETQEHLEKVTSLLESFGTARGRVKCVAIAGIIAEADSIIKEKAEPAVHDAALIGAAQRAEHYEIAVYGTVIAWAKLMNHDEAVSTLESILEQEKAADTKLTDLASTINIEANQLEDEEPPVVTPGRRRSRASSR